MRSRTSWTACLALVLGASVTTPVSLAAVRDQDRPGGTLKEKTSKAIEGVKPAAPQDPKDKPDPAPLPKPGTDKPAPAPPQADTPGPSGPNSRAIANRMAEAVRLHEVRFARLDALIAVFQQQNDTVKLERAQSLKAREGTRYQTELATFKQALGDENYKKLLASLRSAKKEAGDVPKEGSKEEAREREKPGETPPPAERKKDGGR